MTVICVLIPRFALIAACGERRELLGSPAALAPQPGGRQMVGDVSGAAEAHGVRAGMRLGEALSRCPDLALIPPDPGRAAAAWEQVLRRLEGIGAAVESERAGETLFGAAGLRGLHGDLAGTLAAVRRAVRIPARVGAAPSRFAAYAAAQGARRRGSRPGARREAIVPEKELRSFLSTLPVSLLAARLGPDEGRGRDLVESLERLGVRELGALAALPEAAVADRFGPLGLRALRLCRGEEEPLRPRDPHEAIAASIDLPEAAAGQQLERALELLVDRVLAAPRRRGRTLRALRLEARLAGGGGWSARVALRRPAASRQLLRIALAPKLSELPGPAASLRLRAVSLGPAGGDQLELSSRPEESRRQRLGEAVRQVRAAAGADSVLRVLEVDPGSRVPERWALLTPFVPSEEPADRRGPE
jgi:nucleotidyltransferase/DNA polymerase involved in DNA repair